MLWLRQLFRTSARPSRFYTGPQTITAPTTIRHVRFRRPWLRSFFGKCLFYAVAFESWSILVRVYTHWDEDDETRAENRRKAMETVEYVRRKRMKVTAEDAEKDAVKEAEMEAEMEAEKEAERAAKKAAERDAEDHEPLFIPLSWYRDEQEGVYYTAADPEWQEFARISRDGKKIQKLREELTALVLQGASEQMSPFLGGPVTITGLWLIPEFPTKPPPEYVRSGMELEYEGGISLVKKPMDPETGDKLQSFMQPMHVALAIWDAYYVLYKRQLDRIMSPDGQADDVQLLGGRFTLSSRERPNPMVTHGHSQLQPPGRTESIPSNAEPELHPSFFISTLQRLPLPDLSPGSDLHLASLAFKLRLHVHKSETPPTPHRGSFFFNGPVGVRGPNGSCRFEVRGEYDPAKPGWRNVDMKLRDMSYNQQRPHM